MRMAGGCADQRRGAAGAGGLLRGGRTQRIDDGRRSSAPTHGRRRSSAPLVKGISGVAPAQHGKAPGGRGLLQRCSTSANRSGGRRCSASAWQRGGAVMLRGGAAQRRRWELGHAGGVGLCPFIGTWPQASNVRTPRGTAAADCRGPRPLAAGRASPGPRWASAGLLAGPAGRVGPTGSANPVG
jgi:hypothetical protein